ncbi:hypothetical protein ACWCPI_07070 [Streptomyces sp. NPDC001920]
MAENEDGAAGADGSQSSASVGPAGPFLRDFGTLADGYPRVSPRSAVVQFYRNGGYTVKRANGVQHVDKPVLARPHSICEIALGTYVTPLQMELPAAGGTTFFKAEVDIEWSVTDPHLAALEVVTDVAGRLTSPVLERLREVTTTYRVTEAEQANRAITRECAGGRWADLGSELGLRVRLYVRLRVDDRTIEHADEERNAHARARMLRLRQDSYRRMLQGGDLEQLSFMLAADPEGAKDFLEKIRQEGRQDEKDRVARLFAMAASGELATADVETQVLNLLNRGDGRPVLGPIGTAPVRRSRELEASAADRPFNPDWASDEPPRRPPHRTAPTRGGSERHGPGGRERDGSEPYSEDDTADTADTAHAAYDEPGTRTRRRGHRPDSYRPESYRPDSYRADGRDDDGFDEPRTAARQRPYRQHPYPQDPDHDDEPRSRGRGPAHRSEPYRTDADAYDDGGPAGGRRRPRRPELSAGETDFDREADERRDGRRGPAHRSEPYRTDADADHDGGGPRTYRPEPYDADGDPDRDGGGRRTYRPEPYPPQDEREWDRPRRRRRAEDDGWSWAEEDR